MTILIVFGVFVGSLTMIGELRELLGKCYIVS